MQYYRVTKKATRRESRSQMNMLRAVVLLFHVEVDHRLRKSKELRNNSTLSEGKKYYSEGELE